jgi:hypothetical protein
MTIRGYLILAACLSCVGCRAAAPSDSPASAALAGDPPTAGAKTVVYAYYFHQTFRCLSCQMTEEMAAHALEEHFAPQIQAGLVVWIPVNIDKPEGKALRQQFNAQATDFVLARVVNDVCRESKKLDELAGLTDRPDAFSKYLVGQINTCLSSVQSK